MAERDFLIEAFNDCAERLRAGESLDDCLRRYPQQAAELRPMLLGIEALRRARPPVHEVEQARISARFRFEAALQNEPGKRRGGMFILRYVAAAAAVLIIGFGALTALAQSALPGDALYGIKLAGEHALMALAGSSDGERLNDRRIAEIEALLEAGRAEAVTFEGEVGTQTGPDWQIGGLSITVAADTSGAGDIRTGDRVRVSGYTTPEGELIAQSLLLLERGLTPPTATPIPSPIPSATPSPSPTITATASPTRVPTLTPLPATATPFAAAPTDDHGGDSGDDDDEADDDHSGSGGGGQDDDGEDDSDG